MTYDKNDVLRELATLLGVPEAKVAYEPNWSDILWKLAETVTDGSSMYDGIYDTLAPDSHSGAGLKKDFPTALDAAKRIDWMLNYADWYETPEEYDLCAMDYVIAGLGKCKNRAWISFLVETITDHGEEVTDYPVSV